MRCQAVTTSRMSARHVAHGAVVGVGALVGRPLLPARDRPQQDALVVVDHCRLPRPGELEPVLLGERDRTGADALEQFGGGAGLHRDQVMGVAGARHPVGAELGDRTGPGRGLEDAIDATAAELGGLGPPLLEAGVLCALADGLDRERVGEAVPALVLPQVDDLGPPPGRPDHRPDAVAELLALDLRLGAPVRGHVVHVVGAVVPDDVDELVDVDLVVHGTSILGSRRCCATTRTTTSSTGSRSASPDRFWRRNALTIGRLRRQKRSDPAQPIVMTRWARRQPAGVRRNVSS